VGNIDRQIHSREDQQKTIAEDQARLRENLKALKGSAEERELVQRYTHQLNAQEDTLDRVKRELVDLRSQHDVAQSDLKKTIDELSLDATL
jgi:ribosomal protein L29